MSWQVSVQPRAEADLWKAWDWYHQRQAGLAEEFTTSIGDAFALIEESADRFPVYFEGLRRVLVRRFPYKVFYRIEADLVVIIRILHTSQDHRSSFEDETAI